MTTFDKDLITVIELAAKAVGGRWKTVGHSWEEASVYTDQRDYPICTARINPDVTEDTQATFESEMDDNIAFIAAAKNLFHDHGEQLKGMVSLTAVNDYPDETTYNRILEALLDWVEIDASWQDRLVNDIYKAARPDIDPDAAIDKIGGKND